MILVQLDEDTRLSRATDWMTAECDESIRSFAGGSDQVSYELIEPATAAGFDFTADDDTKHGDEDDTPVRYYR